MNRPDLTCSVRIGEEEKRIKWTYGLSTDIQRLIPGVEDAIAMLARPELSDYVLRRCLTEKKGFVKAEAELIAPETIDEIEPDDVLMVLEWVQAHLLYFFGTSAEYTHRHMQTFKETLGRLNPSTDGSQVSTLETPAAGPSA